MAAAATDGSMLLVSLVFLIPTVLFNAINAEQNGGKPNIVIAFDSEKDNANLRQALDVRNTGVNPPRKALNSEGLAQEISETLKLLDKIETEQLKLMDTVRETAQVSQVQAQAEANARDLKNATMSDIERLASKTKLQNQRVRNRSNRRQGHKGMTNAIQLSNDYVRSSILDTQDRIQNVRHEAIGSRAKTRADVRDTLHNVHGRLYEDYVRDVTDLRNKLNAARADRISSTLGANAAVRKHNRQNALKRRIDRLNRLAKAREAYAKAYLDDDN